MIGLLMLGSIINYLTRSSLGVSAQTLMTDLQITTEQYSWIVTTFQLTIMLQPLAGYVLDVLGLKIGFAIFAIAWSLISMAHGLESRVPLLDHPIVELAATVPPDIKFRAGEMKRLFRSALGDLLPAPVRQRTDKMGFPTPFAEWLRGDAADLARDLLSTRSARERPYIDNTRVLTRLEHEPRFGRGMWGFLSLELWQRAFHDRAQEIRKAAA